MLREFLCGRSGTGPRKVFTGQWPENRFPIDSSPWKPVSALKLLGYTVGKKGWAQQDRRDFLQYFVEAHLPRRVTELFGNEYAHPSSDDRILKVAWLLSANIRNFSLMSHGDYAVAIEDWRDDLDFIWRIYGAHRPGCRSRWPRRTPS